MFVALFVVLMFGCGGPLRPKAPAVCGEGWARLDAFALPDVAEPAIDRAHTSARTIASVRVAGVDAALARTLEATLETRAGQVLVDAPIAADLRRLWALGVIDDARIDLDGDRVTFVLVPRPRIGRVVLARRDPSALRRFEMLAGATYEPQRIARIAAAVKLNYVREGHLDAHVDVGRQHRGALVDVCVAASPGPKVTIRSVTFPGRKLVPEATLLAQIHGKDAGINHPGGLYDADALEFAEAFLLNEYYERGMLQARIGDVRVERDGDQLDLEIPVDEGPEFTIGTVSIRIGTTELFGAPRVKLPIGWGDLFKRSRVQAARDAIIEATGADVTPLTKIDPAFRRVHITFEIDWRYPWDALRLWLLR